MMSCCWKAAMLALRFGKPRCRRKPHAPQHRSASAASELSEIKSCWLLRTVVDELGEEDLRGGWGK